MLFPSGIRNLSFNNDKQSIQMEVKNMPIFCKTGQIPFLVFQQSYSKSMFESIKIKGVCLIRMFNNKNQTKYWKDKNILTKLQ